MSKVFSQQVVIVLGMLLSGSCNTLLSKLQDRVCTSDCYGSPKYFSQPIWQTLNMFLGELICLVAYLFYSNQSRSKHIVSYDSHRTPRASTETAPLLSHPLPSPLSGSALLLPCIPAVCDILATTLLNVGLMLVSASIYQMMRGAVVLFTGFFSIFYLKKSLPCGRVTSLFIILAGVGIVGASPLLSGKSAEFNLFGLILIIIAQLITAVQFTYEEHLLNQYEVSPLKLVGMEGAFGTLIITASIVILSVIDHPVNEYLDVREGAAQIVGNKTLWISAMGSAICVAFFNYCGVNITKYVSATSRTTVDTCRTAIIWIVSLALHWETFLPLQIVGFLVLIYGTFVFNMVMPLCPCLRKEVVDEESAQSNKQ